MGRETTFDFSARDAVEGVSSLFVERWSPRAFRGSVIAGDVLARIFDAARWSPSCFNEQPWRFYTSTQETFADYVALLVEGNQVWAKHAGLIGFVVGKRQFSGNGKENAWSAFDCGAAWMAMTLQARMEGLYTHGMGGIRKEAVAEYLQLDPDRDQVLMGFALGYVGDKGSLSEDLQAREQPSARKALDEIWFS